MSASINMILSRYFLLNNSRNRMNKHLCLHITRNLHWQSNVSKPVKLFKGDIPVKCGFGAGSIVASYYLGRYLLSNNNESKNATGHFNFARTLLSDRLVTVNNLFSFQFGCLLKTSDCSKKGSVLSQFVVNAAEDVKNNTITVSPDDKLHVPEFNIARKVRCDSGPQNLKLTLFQYQTCPFCCKVRAYLDYHGFNYDVIEVNSVSRKETKWSTKYKKVPILVCREVDGTETALHDSSVIISLLQSWRKNENDSITTLWKYYPEIEKGKKRGRMQYEYPNKYFMMYGERKMKKPTEQEGKLERHWRAWVDDVLVHTLSPNIYRTPSEALQSFHYFSDVGDWERIFTTWERYVVIYAGSAVMYLLGKSLKKKYELKDDVRESLYDACNDWSKQLGKKPFLGGDRPNLADLSMYGAMSAIEGCAAFQDILKNTKQFGSWYYRTQKAVRHNEGTTEL